MIAVQPVEGKEDPCGVTFVGLTVPREFREIGVSAPVCQGTLGSLQTADPSAWSVRIVHRT